MGCTRSTATADEELAWITVELFAQSTTILGGTASD